MRVSTSARRWAGPLNNLFRQRRARQASAEWPQQFDGLHFLRRVHFLITRHAIIWAESQLIRSGLSLWKICQPGRVWKPTLLEDLTDPRNGGRIGRSGRVKAISRRVAAVWPRGAYPWMPRGLWRLQATEGGPWGRPWRVPRTLLRSSALRRSAGKSASLLLLCLPRNLCNSNSHPRCC